MAEYTLYIDESGNMGASHNQSNGFVFGGYVINKKDESIAIRTWRELKTELCGSDNVELKWNHFFKSFPDNPLIAKSTKDKREAGINLATRIFEDIPLIPNLEVIRKNRASEAVFTVSKKGNSKIDLNVLWVAPVGAFAGFLSRRKSVGKIVRDKVSGLAEEQKWQENWTNLRIAVQGQPQDKLLSLIDEEITFVDSANHDLIQIADCICGIIFSASIENEAFLYPVFAYFEQATKNHGMGIIKVE